MSIIDDLMCINQKVCERLWQMWSVSNGNAVPCRLPSHLIFSSYGSNGRVRISEQEARFTYAEVVGKTPYYYSVETPTEKSYRFTGVGQRSAQSDMSLYLASDDSFKRVANVELKSGNPPEKHIKKDIEKLVCEGCFNKQVDSHLHGNWFHLLENTDSGTLPALFTKMKNSFFPYSLCAGRVSIVLCFCVLGSNPRSGWACLGHFDYCVNHHCYTTYLEKFFSCIDGQLSPDWKVIKIN